MPDPRPTLVRLAKGPRYDSLWRADDHLLHTTGEGLFVPWSERYGRFYLRDIEGFFSVPSGEWKAVSILLGLAGIAALAMVAIFWRELPMRMIWLGLAGIMLAWLGVRLLRGQGVVLHVQTAAGTPAIARLSRARAQRLMAELAPLIEAAQTDLPPLKPVAES